MFCLSIFHRCLTTAFCSLYCVELVPILALMIAFSFIACFVDSDIQCGMSILVGLPKISLDVLSRVSIRLSVACWMDWLGVSCCSLVDTVLAKVDDLLLSFSLLRLKR